jgi:putative addiction module component (TIGR02574 family)
MPTAAKTTRLDRVFKAAQQLTPKQRERLVGMIVPTLPGLKQKPLTGAVLDRRLEELRSGRVKSIPVEDVMAEALRLARTGKRLR